MVGQINTGIDKLVELVKELGSVSISDAARTLGVSHTLVEEWSYFLEERGVLDLDYRLSGTFLVSKNISTSEIKKKKETLTKDKAELVKSLKSNTSNNEKAIISIGEFKSKTKKFVDKVSSDFAHVKESILALEELEDSFALLSKSLIEYDNDFKMRMGILKADVDKLARKYSEVTSTINNLEKDITDSKKDVMLMLDDERKIIKEVDRLKSILDQIRDAAERKEKDIFEGLKKVEVLREEISSIAGELSSNKAGIEELMKERKLREKEMAEMSKSIRERVMEREKDIFLGMDDIRKIEKDLATFLSKKDAIDKLLRSPDEKIQIQIEKVMQEAQHLDMLSRAVDIRDIARTIRKEYALMKIMKEKTHKDFESLSKTLKK